MFRFKKTTSHLQLRRAKRQNVNVNAGVDADGYEWETQEYEVEGDHTYQNLVGQTADIGYLYGEDGAAGSWV